RARGRGRGELHEDAAARPRMHECDLAGEPRARRGIEQLDAHLLERGQRLDDVRCIEAEVMESLAPARQEPPDTRRWIERLEKLDLALAGSEQRRAHVLVGERRLLA